MSTSSPGGLDGPGANSGNYQRLGNRQSDESPHGRFSVDDVCPPTHDENLEFLWHFNIANTGRT